MAGAAERGELTHPPVAAPPAPVCAVAGPPVS